MKTIGKVIFNKTLFVILTITIMLFSNFAPIISWAVEGSEGEEPVGGVDEYVKFDLSWANGENEITNNAGQISAKFTLQFDTIENFKDFRIEVERTDKVKVYYSNNGEYYDNSSSASQIQYLKDIPGGTKLNGNINFEFSGASDFQIYQKNLVVKLIGTYELDGEEINVELTRNLLANITTPPSHTYHKLKLDVVEGVHQSVKTSSNTNELYSVSELTQNFNFNYYFNNSEYRKFEFSIYRTTSNNDRTYYPDEVTVFGMNPTKVGDGEYVLEMGMEHEEYDEANVTSGNQPGIISAKYIIEDAAEDVSTTGNLYITLISKGYDVTKSESGVTAEKTTLQECGSNSKNAGLHSSTTGNESWGNSYINTSENGYTYFNKNDMEEFIQNDKMEVKYDTSLKYINGIAAVSSNTTITQNARRIEYYDYDTSEYKTKYCTQDSMYVKKIEIDSMKNGENVWIKFYKQGESEPFFTATSDNLTYIASENEKIGDFYAIVKSPLYNMQNGWKTTYELSASDLKNEGLTDENIKNIRTIKAEQYSNKVANIYTATKVATYYIVDGNTEDISHFGVYDRWANLNTDTSQAGIEERGEISLILYNSISDSHAAFFNVKNTNPTFYVKLPREFTFNIEDIYVSDYNNMLRIKKWEINKYNGKKVLEIQTEGENGENSCTIYIKYKRTLNLNCSTRNGKLEVYMKTDEGKYYNHSDDIDDYNKNGDTTDKLGYCAVPYTIAGNSQIQLKNNVYSAFNEMKVNEDIKLEPGKTVKYAVMLNNDENTISNINIISRLPYIGNKSIKGNNLINLGTTVSLENLRNIEIYEEYQGEEILIDPSNYQIGYSSEETANFETTYDTSDSSRAAAKTLQVKMNDTYKLYQGNTLIVKYELDIPADAEYGKIAAQTSAVKYTDSENDINIIEGAKSNVVVGSSAGTIEIVKKFEGENNAESLENIQFKLTNMDDTTKFYTGTTDVNGHVIFTNIPVGDYVINELTEFENYEVISPQYVTISNGEEYIEVNGKSILFENKMKISKIEINKTWEDTNDIQSEDVEFEIKGTAVNGEEKTITTKPRIEHDEEGKGIQKAIVYMPYGSYTIKETKGAYGWNAEDVNIEANQETINVDIENKITKGNIEIIKTVPEGDSVEGLTFKITGIGDVSYINKEGTEVLFEQDFEIQIAEDSENIEISEDKRTAKITIPNMPVGTYKIEEINMPKIDTASGLVTKYTNIKKAVRVPDEKGKITEVLLENKHKTGNINVNIIIPEDADMEDFKDIEIKVSGTSYYGNNFEQTIAIPSSGKLSFTNLEIGTYKVEELNTKEVNGKIYTIDPEGFEVTYEPQESNTTGAEVRYARTTTVNINHEYTGEGIVKIEKALEGETDISKANGIEFKIIGKDLLGKDINETITIGEDGTGISNPIPVGTYLLTEVESTVPDIYEVVEDQEITIKMENTEENPLVLAIENKLAENKIIMETELVTGGYPPTPVTYEVTKVDDNLQAIEEPVKVIGDSKSYAELMDLKGGKYLVKQKIVPEGYKADDDQLVKVTRDSMGYALFLIDKEQKEEINTTVMIQKELLNEQGETATTQDFINAKLDIKENYSFEVRLQNKETKGIYYTFIENDKTDTIQGLPYGTYEVEEIYKPKYKMLEITGEDVIKNEETGKYTFTLSSTKKKIEFTIKNQIDKNFGFGGEDTKDNLSKILSEEVEQVKITKARIYVRDEEDNKISNAEFKLYNEQGELLKLAGNSGEYAISEEGTEVITPTYGTITLKALPEGNYKLVNERADESLLQADNKIVTVYNNVVGITRIELLKNIPRGSLRLSTTYTNTSGETKYVPKSKYKILNPETEEILTFIKKADGTYYRSNLPNATETITLKSGYTDVKGIEAGATYKVGLVGLTEKYGVIKEEPEIISVEEEESKELNVNTERRTAPTSAENTASGEFKQILSVKKYQMNVYTWRIALDYEGNIWSSTDRKNFECRISDRHFKEINFLPLYCSIDR